MIILLICPSTLEFNYAHTYYIHCTLYMYMYMYTSVAIEKIANKLFDTYIEKMEARVSPR